MMHRAKRYKVVTEPEDPELAELNPVQPEESPVLSSRSGSQLNEDLGEFLEDASRSSDRFNIRTGFYTKTEDITPRHVVDQADLKHHREGHFHQRHPMSLYSHVGEKRKKRKSGSKSGSHRRRHGSKKKRHSSVFKPSMEGVPETGSETDSEEESEESTPGPSRNQSPRVSTSEPTEERSVATSATRDETGAPVEEAGPTEEPPGGITPSGTPTIVIGSDTPDSIPRATFSLPAEDSEEEDRVLKLHDVLSAESTTDPDMDPGVKSVDARRGEFTPTEEGLTPVKRKQSVTFVLGDEGEDSDTKKKDKVSEKKPERKVSEGSHHRHHHRHHHGMRTATLEGRRALGSEIDIKGMNRSIPTEQDEAKTLSGVDLDDMSSHRLGEAHGLRRRKIAIIPKAVTQPSRPGIDHSPHELFVELAELHVGANAEYEWQDTARWIKYEEDVEAEATRYGKPHVASLSFHSLLELRKVLAQGVVLMDLDEEDLVGIVNYIVEQMVVADQLNPEKKGAVMKALLLRHKHVPEGGFLRRNSTAFNILGQDYSLSPSSLYGSDTEKQQDTLQPGGPQRKASASGSFRNLTNFFGSRTGLAGRSTGTGQEKENGEVNGFTNLNIDGTGRKSSNSELKAPEKPENNSKDHVKIDISESASIRSNQSDTNLQASGAHGNILRRIPQGAEATTVLVGEVDFLEQPVMAFVRLAKGCMLGDFTEVPLPVRFLFILLGPPSTQMNYHEIGRSISTLMANARFHDIAYQAEERRDLLNAINDFLDESIVLPPGDYERNTLLPIMDMAKEKSRKKRLEEQAKKPPPPSKDEEIDDPFIRTKKPFGGMVKDIKRRYPKYLSDIKDALNLQCLATFFFIYFACLSPAITFGGLLGEKVDGWMGVSELLIMTSVCGILFALFAGQPLLIVGFTGPIIVFEEGLYQFCNTVGLEYMPFRVWICLWVFVIALIIVCFEGTFLVRYFTRFTMEIFAALISLIFIYEVFYKLYKIFLAHPLQSHDPEIISDDAVMSNLTTNITTPIPTILTNASSLVFDNMTKEQPDAVVKTPEPVGEPNTALLSLILTLGTFFIAYFLKQFRNSKFLGRSARRALGDFGVPIAIAIMVVVDYLIDETYTQKLSVPDGVKPTASDKRGWFIPPMGIDKPLPVWAIFAAVLPGILVSILVFMESQITGMIISKKTKKGTGFHLDLFLIGAFGIIGGLMGLPLVTCATVRSVSHVSALSVMSSTHAPGEKPKLIEVKEQRLTGIAVHIMIGVSVLMGPVLRQVPLAVLFGVFLYMGVASMSGVQLFDRVELFFMPRKHHPEVGYVKKVKTYKMHMYTLLQLVCLAVLWVVKSTQAALAFPFFLILMVPLRRHLLTRAFTEKELAHLDRDDDDGGYNSDEDEPDFYTQAHMPI